MTRGQRAGAVLAVAELPDDSVAVEHAGIGEPAVEAHRALGVGGEIAAGIDEWRHVGDRNDPLVVAFQAVLIGDPQIHGEEPVVEVGVVDGPTASRGPAVSEPPLERVRVAGIGVAHALNRQSNRSAFRDGGLGVRPMTGRGGRFATPPGTPVSSMSSHSRPP